MYRIGGNQEDITPVVSESLLRIPPLHGTGFLTCHREPVEGQRQAGFDWGGRLRKGIGALKGFPSEWLETIRKSQSRRELGCEVDGPISTKVGLSDPVVESGIAIAQRIKAAWG